MAPLRAASRRAVAKRENDDDDDLAAAHLIVSGAIYLVLRWKGLDAEVSRLEAFTEADAFIRAIGERIRR